MSHTELSGIAVTVKALAVVGEGCPAVTVTPARWLPIPDQRPPNVIGNRRLALIGLSSAELGIGSRLTDQDDSR